MVLHNCATWDIGSRSPAPAATPAVSCFAWSPPIPTSRSAPSPRTAPPASASATSTRTCARSPTSCSPDRAPELLADADLVFLALPHGASAALAAELDPGQRVVDLGSDHRLRDPGAHARYYGGAYPRRLDLRTARTARCARAIAGATRVANTGCHAVAVILAAAPLVAAGVASADDVVVTSASGTSGAGRAAAAAPARQRGDGRPLGLQGRRAPARPRDQAGRRASAP